MRLTFALFCLLWPVWVTAEDDRVDINVEWRPGVYQFAQTTTNTLSFAGNRQEIVLSGVVHLRVYDEGAGRMRYMMSYQPGFGSVDGVPMTSELPAVPEVSVLVDGEGRLLEFADQAGLSRHHPRVVEAGIGEVLSPSTRLEKMNVHTGEQWSHGFGNGSLRWKLEQHHVSSGVAELSFQGLGRLIQVPESALGQSLGVALAPKSKALVGQLRLDTLNNRLLRMVSKTTVGLDVKLMGDLAFPDVELIYAQSFDLQSFEPHGS